MRKLLASFAVGGSLVVSGAALADGYVSAAQGSSHNPIVGQASISAARLAMVGATLTVAKISSLQLLPVFRSHHSAIATASMDGWPAFTSGR